MAQQQVSTNTFTTAKWIVSTDATQGTHTTIAAALTSASSGDTIFIRAKSTAYTEDITLKAGVDICAFDCDSETPNVTIAGKMTMTVAGTATISGIRLQTNSDFFLAVTGTLATIVMLKNCFLDILNNTGISHTSSSASSLIRLYKCRGDFGTTGIGLFTSTSAGVISIVFCNIANTGATTTASTTSTGQIQIEHSRIYGPITTSSAGTFFCFHADFFTTITNTTSVTLAGTGTSTFSFCVLQGGTSSAASIGAGTTLQLTDCVVDSSNTNTLTGAGTLIYSVLTNSGTSSGINPTTQTIRPASAFQKIIVQTFTATGTYTPTAGMKYCIAEVVGGGGGGAGTPLTGATTVAAGGGGGGGGYARKTFTAATIGTSQAVTIGTGGAGGTGNAAGSAGVATTLGALLTGNGGNGGGNAGAAANTTVSGGSGGTGGSGDVNITGQGGLMSFGVYSATISAVHSGAGGNSILGGGAQPIAGTAATSSNGNTGGTYGGGGSGSASTESQAAKNGGTGGAGICIVTEYV